MTKKMTKIQWQKFNGKRRVKMKSQNSMGNAKSLFGKRPFGLDNFLGSFLGNFKKNKKLAPKKALSKALPQVLPQKFTPQNLRPQKSPLKNSRPKICPLRCLASHNFVVASLWKQPLQIGNFIGFDFHQPPITFCATVDKLRLWFQTLIDFHNHAI